KTFSIILMVLGAIGIGIGFLSAPKDIQEVERILAESDHGAHDSATEHKIQDDVHLAEEPAKYVTGSDQVVDTTQNVPASAQVAAQEIDSMHLDTIAVSGTVSPVRGSSQVHENENLSAHGSADAHDAHQEHLEHVLHQLQNKPWAALYVACIFFMLLAMGVLAFYAIQIVAQAGWSPVLFRVMHAITAYVLPGSVIFFILLCLSGFHFNHMFVWMTDGITDPNHENYDKLVANKSGYLNVPFWLIRAAVILIGWNLYRFFTAKYSLEQDRAKDNAYYKRNFNISAGFLVFFIVTESIMSWDWIMSLDPHWFSTLFGWYVFASFFVSG